MAGYASWPLRCAFRSRPGRRCFQPAFRVDKKGSGDNHTLTRLNAMENLDPFAETPSCFNLARLEDAVPMLDIDTRARPGIDHRVQRDSHGGR